MLPSNFSYIDIEFVSPLVKNLPLLLSVAGSFICLLSFYLFDRVFFFNRESRFYNLSLKFINFVSPFFFFSGFFNVIYNDLFLCLLKFSYEVNTKTIDKGFIELFGPYGFYKFFYFLHFLFKVFSPSVIFFCICLFFLALCFVIFFFIYVYFIFLVISLNYFNIIMIFFLMVLFDFFVFK